MRMLALAVAPVLLPMVALQGCGGEGETGGPAATESGFEAGAEGWRVADCTVGGPYVTPLGRFDATSAQGSGMLSFRDISDNAFFFDAPEKFLGDRASYHNGSLRFRLRTTHNSWKDDNVVVLSGLLNGQPIGLVAEIPQPAVGSWQSYSVRLVATSFRKDSKNGAAVTKAELHEVLRNLLALRIAGEFGANVEETVDLDDVALVGP